MCRVILALEGLRGFTLDDDIMEGCKAGVFASLVEIGLMAIR